MYFPVFAPGVVFLFVVPALHHLELLPPLKNFLTKALEKW
jgi:hypothetical protein